MADKAKVTTREKKRYSGDLNFIFLKWSSAIVYFLIIKEILYANCFNERVSP